MDRYRRRSLGKTFLLATVIFASCSSSLVEGLTAPKLHKNHEEALNKGNGSEEELASWHGLDYEFDHSIWDTLDQKTKNETKNETAEKTSYDHYYVDGWSDEDYSWGDYNSDSEEDSSIDDIVMVPNKSKLNETGMLKPRVVEEQKKNESEIVKDDKDEGDRVITIGTAKMTSAVPPKEIKNVVEKKEQSDYSWEENEGDSDDGLGGVQKLKKDQTLGNLPTDEDIDAEKYFDPERFKDTLRLHTLEDLLLRQWTVAYPDTNLPCIMLKGSIKLIVPMNPTWYNKDFVEIDVPYDAEASGSCSSLRNDYQEITLNWNVTVGENKKAYLNQVTLGFATNWTSDFSSLNIPADKYALVSVTAVYNKGELGEKAGDTGMIAYSANDLAEFMTPLNQSMSCYKSKQFLLGNMQLTFSGIQLEAFRQNKETLTVGEFSRSVLCSMDEVIVFDAVMTFIIWFWIGALLVVLAIFAVLLALGYRRRRGPDEGFGYKILTA